MTIARACINTIAAALIAALVPAQAALAAPVHGLAMHGQPKYAAGFTHFDYVNPDAPKGGTLKLHTRSAFDSLNGYIIKGVAAPGLGYLDATLMVSSADEPFTEYGLVAESVETPEDRSYVVFRLRPQARFGDGEPVTAEDVAWTFETLKTRGHPFYRFYYGAVEKATVVDRLTVRFDFVDGDNRELPLIMGQLPVLPKHYWEGRDFEKTTLEPPVGAGPYTVSRVEPGRLIEYQRKPDWWGANLGVARGLYNFDRIEQDVYRDETVALEAFKAGEYDFRLESTALFWATEYDFPAVRDGRVVKVEIPHKRSTGMQGFVFNTRRPFFADPRVRRALGYAFNFELANKQLFHGQYTRTKSYFSNSPLASSGLPTGRELEILEKFRGKVPDEVFTSEYTPPAFEEDSGARDPFAGSTRKNLRKAIGLLKEAGWTTDEEGRLVNGEGERLSFEILLYNPMFERVSLPFVKNLERLGIEATVRTVDATQYENRLNEFDFDMVVGVFGQSQSPGNEQLDFWGSESAKTPGGRNLMGITDPVVDELARMVVSAPDREELVARTRALDRVLLWGHYIVPNWHLRYFRVAYWDKFERPETGPLFDLVIDSWWSSSAADQ